MTARDEILDRVRTALGRADGDPVPPVPDSARVPPRQPGSVDEEIDRLLTEIAAVSGVARRLGPSDVDGALADLVEAEQITKATLWSTPELVDLGVEGRLRALGVEVVAPYAGHRAVAECDLGVTGADGALPETGTLLLRSAPDRPRVVSLLPRVHLAIVDPDVLRADLHQVFDAMCHDRYGVLVTGPSRTADIELVLTIGVHGPKALHVWVVDR
jgi:L-lactate dehydrogenase complex protein LldG